VTREVSLYLDLIRFLAALVVFIGHYATGRISGGLLWQTHQYGPEAVTVFFVLSGFVIAHVTDTRERTFQAYGISRAARLYSVVLPAVALTVALDTLGSGMRPDLYVDAWKIENDVSASRLFAALTFTNMLWGHEVRQGSNVAYWSLGYEVPYYLMFAVATFMRSRWRFALLGALCAFFGPAIVLEAPIWLAGVLAYRLCKGPSISSSAGAGLLILSVLGWLAYESLCWRFGRPVLPFDAYGVILRPEILQDYCIAILFFVHLLGFRACAQWFGRTLETIQAPVRWLAGATFTTYLCHAPILHFLVAISPWPATDPRSRVLVPAVAFLTVLALSTVTERKKDAWRRMFASLRISGPRDAA